MTMTTTTTTDQPAPGLVTRMPRRAVYLALCAALAKLVFMSALAACLLLMLVNAIVDALVYTIAGVLALFWSSCSVLTVGHGADAVALGATRGASVVSAAQP